MKYILALYIVGFMLSCKKEDPPVLPLPFGASNIMEGDIVWGGATSTHFKNQPANPTSTYAYFNLDTLYTTSSYYQIEMTGYEADTIVTFQFVNLNLNTPGVYNFQDLDSNHVVAATLQSGYGWGGSPAAVSYSGISYSNKGRLTVDTISQNHISGSIDTYCNRENLITNIPDTNEVHLLFHFSGDLRKD